MSRKISSFQQFFEIKWHTDRIEFNLLPLIKIINLNPTRMHIPMNKSIIVQLL